MEKPSHWRFDDLNGRQFGRWTVVGLAGRCGKKLTWDCRCSCGKTGVVHATALRSGASKSCGCLRREAITKHGGAYSPEYGHWTAMKARCHVRSNIGHKHYGGRGIKVCDRWLDSFDAFLADMGPRPGPDLSVDRIDSNGDYCPENCRWASRETQSNNTRRCRKYEIGGRTMTITQWAREHGIPPRTLTGRMDAGMGIEEAISLGTRTDATITHGGRSLTLVEWSEITGFSPGTIRGRLKRGWSAEAALSRPLTR